MAISQSILLNKARSYTRSRFQTASERFNSINKTSAFLCHSHNDKELVMGLIVVFKEAGLDLYVDWKDHSLPETPNGETAREIKAKIKSSNVFLFLATANAKASRWCPWEIGFADSSEKGIYIIPTADGGGTYGNEYLQLYSRIDSGIYEKDGSPGYFMLKPGETTGYAISNNNIR